MMHPSIKRKTVFGARPAHLPIRGLRHLGFLPLLPDGTWIQRQPGEPDQKIQGPPPDLTIPYLSQTVSLIADGVYVVPPQPAGSTNFVFSGTNPDAGSYSGPQPTTQATVLAAEQAAEANAAPATYSAPPVPQSPVAGNAFVPSPTTQARAQAAAAPPPSWFDGSTTLLGFTLSNSTLAIGGVALAAALYYFSGKKSKR